MLHVEVCKDGRWSLMSTEDRQADAVGEAERQMASKKYDAVRVIFVPTKQIVYEAEAADASLRIAVGTITESPVCASVEDTWKAPARMMGARLLRPYLEQNETSLSEVWFTGLGLRRLLKEDRLMQLAVSTVAKIQSEKTDTKAAERSKALYDLIAQQSRALKSLPGTTQLVETLQNKGLDSMVAAAKEHHPKAPALLIRSALADYSRQMPEAARKLESILDVFDIAQPKAENIPYMDEMLAEIMSGSSGLKAVLGYQSNRASAIYTIAHLWRGSLKSARDPILVKLNVLMGLYEFPMIQDVLKVRLTSELNGATPLQNNRDREASVFKDLLIGMTTPSGLIGQENMAAALTRRGQIALKPAINDLSIEESIQEIFLMLPSRIAKIKYATDLLYADLPPGRVPFASKVLTNMVTKINDVSHFAPLGSDNDAVNHEVTALIDRIAASSIEGVMRDEITDMLKSKLNAFMQGKIPRRAAPKKTSEPKTGKKMNQLKFAPGEIIFNEGEKGDAAYLINAGKVAIFKENGNEEIILGHLGRGDIFGEMALIDSEPRMASARSVEATTLSVLPEEAFRVRLEKLEERDRVMRKVMDVFVTRLRDMAERTKNN